MGGGGTAIDGGRPRHVEPAAFGKVGRGFDVQQPALAAAVHLRRAGDFGDLAAVGVPDHQGAGLAGQDDVAGSRQKGHAPGPVQPLGQGFDPIVVGKGRAGCHGPKGGGGCKRAGCAHDLLFSVASNAGYGSDMGAGPAFANRGG
jgi:hypothetical protein